MKTKTRPLLTPEFLFILLPIGFRPGRSDFGSKPATRNF
jgi:hypothetical protein